MGMLKTQSVPTSKLLAIRSDEKNNVVVFVLAYFLRSIF